MRKHVALLSPFDFDLLHTFLAVTDNEGFTRAAERVGRTQSTVSLQIKKLEEGLGRRLFDRDGRRLQLTPNGEILLQYARQILRLSEEARSRFLEPDIEGTVRLGTPEDFATFYLPGVLARFARTNPRVALAVNCNFTYNLLEGFSRGECDIVLVKREPQGLGGGVAVWHDVLVWVIGSSSVVDSDQPVPLVLAPTPDVYRKRALAALHAAQRNGGSPIRARAWKACKPRAGRFGRDRAVERHGATRSAARRSKTWLARLGSRRSRHVSRAGRPVARRRTARRAHCELNGSGEEAKYCSKSCRLISIYHYEARPIRYQNAGG